MATAIDSIAADIQAQVGTLLQCRSRLISMASQTSMIDIASQANDLLVEQTSLETRLTDVTAIIDKVKTDVYTYSDIIAAGSFYAEMMLHIQNVDSLQSQFEGRGGKITGTIDTKTMMILAGIAFAIYKLR